MSEQKAVSSTDNAEPSAELDDLLDSALEDFTKYVKKPSTEVVAARGDDSHVQEATTSDNWTEDFIKQAASQFETNMASILNGVPGASDSAPLSSNQVQQSLQKMAEAAAQVASNPTTAAAGDEPSDFSRTISQTLQGLSQGAESLQNPFNEEDLMNMFGSFGVGDQAGAGAADPGNAFLPIMQGMMQSLLSKDVLYPSLKDIVDRFPEWIDNNKETVSAEDMERYVKQQDLMKTVCVELQMETDADGASVKQERFEKVLGLMQKLQDYGQPPAELVGETGPGLQFDAEGNPVMPCLPGLPGGLPSDPNQCSLM